MVAHYTWKKFLKPALNYLIIKIAFQIRGIVIEKGEKKSNFGKNLKKL